MTKNLFAHLVGFACALFLWESQSLGQNLSGTSLSVSGTGSISVLTTGTATINLLTSGTASFNEVSVTGVTDFLNNTLYFGTSGTTSALSLIYDDGGNSSVTLKSTKPSAVWNWQRLTSNGTSTATAMQLDASNRLILTGTAAANPPQLVLDPNGAITVNGSSLLTQTDADARYITSSGTAAYALASNSAASLSGTIQATQVAGLSTVATSGSYGSLTGAPTNVSSFTNDAGYVAASGTASGITLSGTTTITDAARITGGLVVTGTASVVTSGTTTKTKIVASGANQLVLIPEQGDLSMGDYTDGSQPQ